MSLIAPGLTALLLCAAGLAAETAAPAAAAPAAAPAADETTLHTEGGALRPFYAEVKHHGRYYLFGSKPVFARFRDSGYEPNPLISKMFIGKGPQRATVVAQTDKETPEMTERLMRQFRARHGLAQ